jgi:hypothetical protein
MTKRGNTTQRSLGSETTTDKLWKGRGMTPRLARKTFVSAVVRKWIEREIQRRTQRGLR